MPEGRDAGVLRFAQDDGITGDRPTEELLHGNDGWATGELRTGRTGMKTHWMKRLGNVWAMAAAIALLWPATGNGAVGAAVSGTLKGVVNNGSGPVVGVRVTVDSSGDSSFSVKSVTTADGTFTVANTPAGTVHVKVYNGQGKVVGSGSGVLKSQGDVLSLTIKVSP